MHVCKYVKLMLDKAIIQKIGFTVLCQVLHYNVSRLKEFKASIFV